MVPLLEEQEDVRREMYFDSQNNLIYLSILDGIVKPLDGNTADANKKTLEAMVEFCDLYREYTDGNNEEVASLAMESLIYGLLSPLVWKIRLDNDPGVRRDI